MKIFLAVLFFSLSVLANDGCELNGKAFNGYPSADLPGVSGKMQCQRQLSGGAVQKTTYLYKDGFQVEEKTEGPQDHRVKKYMRGKNNNQWLDGEQMKYDPKSGVLTEKENYKASKKSGLQTYFDKDGRVSKKEFYIVTQKKSGNQVYDREEQTADISYNSQGQVTSIHCSENKETTIDPTLCGFNGASQVERRDGDGKIAQKLTFVKGKLSQSEAHEEKQKPNAWGDGIFVTGVLPNAKDHKTVTKVNSDGSKDVTEFYASQAVKRKYKVSSNGQISGQDDEYFENGQMARKSELANIKVGSNPAYYVQSSQCWWQNGKPRKKVSLHDKTYEVTIYYDNGQIDSQGSYQVSTEYEADPSEVLFTCADDDIDLVRDGKFQSFHKDGTPRMQANYIKGDLDGAEKEYNDKGILLSESVYIEGVLQKKKLYKDSKVISDKEYFPDGSEKK